MGEIARMLAAATGGKVIFGTITGSGERSFLIPQISGKKNVVVALAGTGQLTFGNALASAYCLEDGRNISLNASSSMGMSGVNLETGSCSILENGTVSVSFILQNRYPYFYAAW